MKSGLVSIIMPVKNTGRFLQTCLDSIYSQTYPHWELLAIDDHSTDHSRDILEINASRDSRIRVFENEGAGIIAALQTGYDRASGSYMTRMDADDIMKANKLRFLLDALLDKGRGYVAVGLVEYFSDEELGRGYKQYAAWLNRLTRQQSNFDQIYKECTIPSPCWMTSRADFEKSGAFSREVYPEDYDLAFRFRKSLLKIASVCESIHLWRDHPNRTSRTDLNYGDNRFTELKVAHFIEQDLNKSLPLIIWGAGKKGKQIIKTLNRQQISADWICNNDNKIGHEIYGKVVQKLARLNTAEPAQVIIAVSDRKAQKEITRLMKANEQHQYFFFT